MQSFLKWLFQKSKSINESYKPSAIRAFYYALDFDRTIAFDRACAHDLDRILTFDHAIILGLDHRLARDLTRTHNRNYDHIVVLDLNIALALTLSLALISALDHALAFALDRALDRALSRSHALAFELNLGLAHKLQQLRIALPTMHSWENFHHWWHVRGKQWVEQLHQMIIKHCNIDHDWHFTDEQKQQLEGYYNANKFLVELMNIEGAISTGIRTQIEDMLFLPWEELQLQRPDLYRELH